MIARLFRFALSTSFALLAVLLAGLATAPVARAGTCFYEDVSDARYWYETGDFTLRGGGYWFGCADYERDVLNYHSNGQEAMNRPLFSLTGNFRTGTGSLTIRMDGKTFEHRVHALRGSSIFAFDELYGLPTPGAHVFYRMTFRTSGSGDPEDYFARGLRGGGELLDWAHSGADWDVPPPYYTSIMYRSVFAPVPLPPTALLSLAGLAALPLLRRRRARPHAARRAQTGSLSETRRAILQDR